MPILVCKTPVTQADGQLADKVFGSFCLFVFWIYYHRVAIIAAGSHCPWFLIGSPLLIKYVIILDITSYGQKPFSFLPTNRNLHLSSHRRSQISTPIPQLLHANIKRPSSSIPSYMTLHPYPYIAFSTRFLT